MHALTWLEWLGIAWVSPAVLVVTLLLGSLAFDSLRHRLAGRHSNDGGGPRPGERPRGHGGPVAKPASQH